MSDASVGGGRYDYRPCPSTPYSYAKYAARCPLVLHFGGCIVATLRHLLIADWCRVHDGGDGNRVIF